MSVQGDLAIDGIIVLKKIGSDGGNIIVKAELLRT
jgi:hypothetical protein